MQTYQHRLWLWLLPIMWATLIFTASADPNSSERSSRIIGPLVRWLAPGISAEALDRTVFAVRKCAHLAEYAVLAVLVWLAASRSPVSAATWWLAWALSVAYAVTDEIHQALVPGRTGTPGDVLLDAIGAAAGLLVAAQLIRWRRRRTTMPKFQ